MKKFKSLCLVGGLLVFSQGIRAEEAYIGIDFINGSGDFDVTTSGSNVTVSEEHDTSGKRFHFGFIQPDGNRFQFTFGSIDFDFDSGTEEISGFDFDYFWVWPENKVNPFITLGLGLYDYEDTAQLFISNEDLSGAAFNFGGGVIVDATENLEFEISYRFKRIVWQDIVAGGTTLETGSSLGNIHFGFNVTF